MASSKSDAKPRKIVDVAAPGKAEPSATARPIIVTNRPMIRRDPMMATGTPETAPEATPAVSRVAKTVKIMPISSDGVSDHSAVTSAKTTPDTLPATDSAPANTKHADQKVALEVGMEALESIKSEAEKDAGTTPPANDQPAASDSVPIVPSNDVSPDEETVAEPQEPARVMVRVPAPSKDGQAEQEPASVVPAQAVSAEQELLGAPAAEDEAEPVGVKVAASEGVDLFAPEQDDKAEEAAAEPEAVPVPAQATTPGPSGLDTSVPQPADTGRADEQLPASQVIEDEAQKRDGAATQAQAEQEKIIASKRYYLPIKPRNRRRGLVRAIIFLALVIILSLVWLDVVLDAGIVHIAGLHALTNYFQ